MLAMMTIDISRTVLTVTVSIIYYIVLLGFSLNKYNYTIRDKNALVPRSATTLKLLCYIFCLFPFFVPDYEGHQMVVSVTRDYGAEKSHIESVYNWLMLITDYDYLLFRLIIISISFYLLNYSISNFGIDNRLCWYLAIIFIILPLANIIRSTLADMFAFVGILFYYKKRTLKSLFTCMFFFLIAFIFHKSVFMVVVPFIFSLRKIRRIEFQSYFLILPLLIIVSRIIVAYIFNIYFDKSEYNSEGDFILSKRILYYIGVLVNIMVFYYAIINGRVFLRSGNFIGYIYRFILYSFLIWICLCFSGTSHYVASRFVAHTYLPLILYLAFMTRYLRSKRIMLTNITVYVMFSALSAIMMWRDCLLQMIKFDFLQLK